MSFLQALIFDVDGTLADTEEMHRQAFNITFKEYGLNWHWDIPMYHELLAVTGGKERIHHFVKQYRPECKPVDDFEQYVADMHKDKTAAYNELLVAGEIPLRPGVERLLREAMQQSLRLAIATTTSLANVEGLIAHTLGKEALGWFDAIAAGDMVEAKKPAPDVYLLALKQLNLSAAECIAFEDSENGIKSATAANLRTVITTNDFTTKHCFDGAIIVLDQLGEPEKGFKVINGDAQGHFYFDIALLKSLYKQR